MSTFKALLVSVDEELSSVEWEIDEERTVLSYLQATVGGHHKLVDVVALSDSVDMWIGDESAVDGSQLNRSATYIARLLGQNGPYFGPAVFTGGPDEEGDTSPLGEHQADLLRQVLS